MTPIGPILQYLCLIPLLGGRATGQTVPPKPASVPPEVAQWIREHAGDWDHGDYLGERLRAAKSLVLVAPAQANAAAVIHARCFEVLLARPEPVCIAVSTSWEQGSALDTWLADGKGAPPALLEKSFLEQARAWNGDAQHARKLRAVGIDYRATREAALGLTEFVIRVDPQQEQRTEQLLAPFRQVGADGRNRYDKVDESWRFAVQQLLGDLDGQVAERRADWEKTVGAPGLAAGLRWLGRLRQAEQEFSKPAEFRRGRALCQNAAAARDEVANGLALVALLPGDAPLEVHEAHTALGEGALVVLLLGPGDDADFGALSGVRAGGALDLRDLPREGPVAAWFAPSLGKRADLVLWVGMR